MNKDDQYNNWSGNSYILRIKVNDRNIDPTLPRCHSDEFGDWMDEKFGSDWSYWSYDDATNEMVLFIPDEESAFEIKLVWG